MFTGASLFLGQILEVILDIDFKYLLLEISQLHFLKILKFHDATMRAHFEVTRHEQHALGKTILC